MKFTIQVEFLRKDNKWHMRMLIPQWLEKEIAMSFFRMSASSFTVNSDAPANVQLSALTEDETRQMLEGSQR